jgi:hypothetical protein
MTEFHDPADDAIELELDLQNPKVIEIAKRMHYAYEEVAKSEGWKTQESCQVEFENLPEKNQRTMLRVARIIFKEYIGEKPIGKLNYLTEKEAEMPLEMALAQITLGLQTCKTKGDVIELLKDAVELGRRGRSYEI